MGYRYIVRLEYDRCARGWRVRVPGQPHKTFADARFGGKRKALQAALAYRDSLPLPRRAPFKKECRRNTSGVIGVATIYVRSRHVWIAYIGSSRYKTLRRQYFSSKKYGSRARKLAIATRRQWEQELLASRG
jgi:hypothetical protein